MKLKTIAIAAAVLLAAAVLGWLLNRPSSGTKPQGRVGEAILDAATFQKAAKLHFFSGPDESTLRATERYWVVEDSQDFPVQREFLSQFIFKLAEIKLERLVTRDASVFPELGVMTVAENGGQGEANKTGVEFQMFDEQGNSLMHVVFGNRRRGEEGGTVTGSGGMYFRDLDEGGVYLLSGAPRVIVRPTDWIQVVILELEDKTDIQRFTITQPAIGTRTFTRIGDPPETAEPTTNVEWVIDPLPPGRTPSHRAINEVAKGLGDLFMVNVAPPGLTAKEMGREKISSFTIDTFKGVRYSGTVGEQGNKQGERYMDIEASLLPGVTDEAATKAVDEYNRVYKGRMFIIHGWEADRILPSREGMYEEQ